MDLSIYSRPSKQDDARLSSKIASRSLIDSPMSRRQFLRSHPDHLHQPFDVWPTRVNASQSSRVHHWHRELIRRHRPQLQPYPYRTLLPDGMATTGIPWPGSETGDPIPEETGDG